MARKLRIAVSAFFGVLTLLLVVLWVRSYWRTDVFVIPTGQPGTLTLASLGGTIALMNNSEDEALTWESSEPEFPQTPWGWAARQNSDGSWIRTIFFPTWFLMVVCTTIASVPWLPIRRFSLRTLLIATTLFAVLLGLAVWDRL